MRSTRIVIGFIGTARGMTPAQREALTRLLSALQVARLHHGCSAGADAQAHEIAGVLGIGIVLHPSTATKNRAAVDLRTVIRVEKPFAAMTRNRNIVRSADLVIAAPPALAERVRRSNGTWELWATVRYARSVGTPVVVLDP